MGQQNADTTNSIKPMIVNCQTLKYEPLPHLMALLVLKANTLKEEDLDLVF